MTDDLVKAALDEWRAAKTEQQYNAAAVKLLPAMADRIEALEADLTEARRRRDEWMEKAKGFDAIRLALRKKVGSPWPPHLSRLMWAGIAADEKARADEAEAEVARLRNLMQMHHVIDDLASGQKPLGADFEAVLEAHLDDLYQR